MSDQGYESFASFKARFLDRAVYGGVSESEWFQYMWNKITPLLRDKTMAIKFTWHESFSAMCTTLLALDQELIRAYNLRKRREANTPSTLNRTDSGISKTQRPFGPSLKAIEPLQTTEIEVDSEADDVRTRRGA